MLSRLDAYEGVSIPPNPADEYIRAVVPVSVGTRELYCWTYLYNWPVLDSQLIELGYYGVD